MTFYLISVKVVKVYTLPSFIKGEYVEETSSGVTSYQRHSTPTFGSFSFWVPRPFSSGLCPPSLLEALTHLPRATYSHVVVPLPSGPRQSSVVC